MTAKREREEREGKGEDEMGDSVCCLSPAFKNQVGVGSALGAKRKAVGRERHTSCTPDRATPSRLLNAPNV